MSSPIPAALLPVVRPLDGEGGYLRWKESMLLRLRTLDMAYVLFEDKPQEEKAAKKWVRDDELCRGHILANLSDRLLPDYVRHATAAAVWRAVERTYDLDMSWVSAASFHAYKFVAGAPVLEQLAHLEALAVNAEFGDRFQCDELVQEKLPPALAKAIILERPYQRPTNMDDIWDIARREEEVARYDEIRNGAYSQRKEGELGGSSSDDDHRSPSRSPSPKRRRSGRGTCDNCGKPGHIAGECRA